MRYQKKPPRQAAVRWGRLLLALTGLLLLPILYYSCRGSGVSPDLAELTAVFGGEADPALAAPAYAGADLTSLYLTMRDGALLAVDLYLPKGLERGKKIPTLIMANRYWRRWDVRFPFSLLSHPNPFQQLFAGHGYALVYVDARGTGASFGNQPHPWSKDELQDYREVVDWAVRQPWSNGKVGAAGASYGGTCAEFMAGLGHPAVKAVAPQFSLYDAYSDVAFPGGVFNEGFVREWGRLNGLLDSGRLPGDLGFFKRLAVRGPAPVPDGPWGSGRDLLAKAQKEHEANVDIYQAAKGVTYRDDVAPGAGVSIDAFSPHSVKQKAERGGVAVYSWGGWFDGAYAGSALKRFDSTGPNHRAVVGPWNHGGGKLADPFMAEDAAPTPPVKIQQLELLRFFNYWLKGEGRRPDAEVVYYTLGEGKWKHSPSWPPAGQTPRLFYLDKDRRLSAVPPSAETGEDVYKVDFTAGGGEKSRWRTQLDRGDVRYPDRAEADKKLLVYESAPLDKDMEVTGNPSVTLFLTATEEDCALHVYLEDVDEKGQVRLLTEGSFRVLHRDVSFEKPPYAASGSYHTFLRKDGEWLEPGELAKTSFGMLPVSTLFKKGHKVRLAVAGADKDQFARIPAEGDVTVTLYRNAIVSSFLELPVIDPNAPPKAVGPADDEEPEAAELPLLPQSAKPGKSAKSAKPVDPEDEEE